MIFSDLKKNTIVEGTLYLKLSEKAFVILLHDQEVFGRNKKPKGAGSISNKLIGTFINHVFNAYREEAKASISVTLNNIERKAKSENNQKKDIEAIRKFYEGELCSYVNDLLSVKTTESARFRVSPSIIKYLSDEGNGEGQYYDDDVSKYMRAVLEEYASLPQYAREAIFFRKQVEVIRIAMSEEKLLKVKLYREVDEESADNNTSGGDKHKDEKYIKVMDIQYDNEMLYNYVVGYIVENGLEQGIGTIRLSQIRECAVQRSHSGILTKSQRAAISKAIQERGLQFVSEKDPVEVVVRFTNRGKSLLLNRLHLRPKFMRIREDGAYVFSCTIFQAIIYFFQFGSEAVILEPDKLTNSLEKRYKKAQEAYEKGQV